MRKAELPVMLAVRITVKQKEQLEHLIDEHKLNDISEAARLAIDQSMKDEPKNNTPAN